MTTTIRRISTLLALGACLALAACGGDDEGEPIPAEQADALRAQLVNIQGRLDQGSPGACRDVFEHPTDPNQQRVEETLASLPDGVDPDVRSALEQSFDNLWALVESECEEREQEREDNQPDVDVVPEEEPEPEVTETETAPPEETVPPEETAPPEEQELPPEGDGNNEGEIPVDPGEGGGASPGNGNGNGNGNAFGNAGQADDE